MARDLLIDSAVAGEVSLYLSTQLEESPGVDSYVHARYKDFCDELEGFGICASARCFCHGLQPKAASSVLETNRDLRDVEHRLLQAVVLDDQDDGWASHQAGFLQNEPCRGRAYGPHFIGEHRVRPNRSLRP